VAVSAVPQRHARNGARIHSLKCGKPRSNDNSGRGYEEASLSEFVLRIAQTHSASRLQDTRKLSRNG